MENASPVGNGRTSLVRPVAREALVAVAVAAVIAILGAPLGLLWHYVAPTVELVKTSSGWYPMAAEPEGFVADDGWFVVIGVGAGVVVAVGAWLLLRRWRGPAILAAVAVGSFACAALAGWVGHRIGLTEYQRLVRDAVVGTKIQRLPGLRIGEGKLVQPLVAVAGYTLFAAFHYAPSLRNDDPGSDDRLDLGPDPDDGAVSSAPPESTDQSTAQESLVPSQKATAPDAAAPARPAAD